MLRYQLISLFLVLSALIGSGAVITRSASNESGIDYKVLSRIENSVKKGMDAKAFPGCQVLVMKEGNVVYDACFGYYTYEKKQPVTSATLYDLASLTKTTGTLLAVMKLYDEGFIQLSDSLSHYLPFLRGTDKENITLFQLLVHESGLPASLNASRLLNLNDTANRLVSPVLTEYYPLQVADSFFLRADIREAAMSHLTAMPLNGKKYLYSCLNFILLKEVVEAVSHCPMDKYLDSLFYQPMGLKATTFLPLRTHKKEEIAPTLAKDNLRKNQIQGFVHDPDAAILGGVSGNAGLFSTAKEVAMVYQMLLNGGELDGRRYLSTETCQVFTTTTSNSGRRGLGFDKPDTANPRKSPCCVSAPSSVYGHTGYTGTCCWVDPTNRLVYVFLSNRTYPSDGVNKLARLNIRTNIQETIYQALKQQKNRTIR